MTANSSQGSPVSGSVEFLLFRRIPKWSPYLLVVTMIAALIVSLAIFSSLKERQFYQDRTQVATQNIARLLDENISSRLDKIDFVLRALIAHYLEQTTLDRLNPAKLNAYLEKREILVPEVLNLCLFNKEGLVSTGQKNRLAELDELCDRDTFFRLRDNPNAGLVIEGPKQIRAGGIWIVSFSRRISAADGSFAGIAYAQLNTQYFHNILSSIELGVYGAATIRMSDFSLVDRFPEAGSAIGNQNVSPELHAMVAANPTHGHYIATTALDGIERSNAYRKLNNYPFYVIVGLATNDYLSAWISNTLIDFSLAALAILLIIMTSWMCCQNAQQREAEIERQRLTELELREIQHELLAVQRLAHAGRWISDLQSHTQEWSKEVFEIYGQPQNKGPIDYPEIQNYFSPQSWETLSALIRKCMIDGSPYECDVEILRPDGTRRWATIFGESVRDRSGQIIKLRGTVQDISERHRVETERNEYFQKISQLSRHLVASQEDARRRLAADLHDRTSPNLAAIGINSEVAAIALREGDLVELHARMDDNVALIEDTAASIREICADLRPQALDYAGLVPAIETYVGQFMKRTGLLVQCNCPGREKRLTPELESILFRIFQEALTNVAKHAQADSVEVDLYLDSRLVMLTIRDDGTGFDPLEIENSNGLGILNMREMCEFSGGRFTLQSSVGTGTWIQVEINIQESLA